MKKLSGIIIALFAYCVAGFCQVATPTNPISSEIDDNSAIVSWDAVEGAEFYEFALWLALGEEVAYDTTSSCSKQVFGLVSGVQYLWKVRAISYNGDTSVWSNTLSFHTLAISSDCADITNIFVGDMNNNRLLLQWDADASTSVWEVAVGELGSNPSYNERRYTTTNLEYPIDNLFASSSYQFAVRSLCNSSISNWTYLYARYLNENSIRNFPIQINFEDSVENSHIGLISSSLNPWTIGSANNGTTSLYVSNDNGESVSFSNADTAISYAYIDFNIPENAVSFFVDFKYKADSLGENAGMKVYLLPLGQALSLQNLPDENYRIGNLVYNNSNGDWMQEHIELPNVFIGSERRIAFVWYNNSEAESSSAVSIDDIYLTARYCAVPDSLQASNIGATSAMLSWNMSNNQISFNVQYKESSQEEWISLEGVENNLLLYNLAPDTYYSFRVQADCISEESFYSVIDTFKTNALANIPVNLSYEVTDNSAVLSWDDDILAEYWLVAYKENDFNHSWQIDTAMQNSKTLNSLAQNTEYVFKVAAVNYDNDTSTYSNTIAFTTLCTPIHDFPYAINYVLDYNDVSGFVNTPTCWADNANQLSSVGFDISQMQSPVLKFQYLTNGALSIGISSDDGATNTIIANNLSADSFTQMIFSLRDYQYDTNVVVSFYSYSNPHEVTMLRIKDFTIEEGCPIAENLFIDSISTSSVALSWQENTAIDSYILYLKNDNGEVLSSQTTQTNNCIFSNLDEQTTYTIVLYSNCNNSQSIDSVSVELTTLSEGSFCMAPSNFEAFWWQSKGEETLYASWEQENDANLWQVVYKDYYAVAWDTTLVSINPVFTLRNLELGKTYQLKVRTICAPNDTSDFTETATVIIGGSDVEDIASVVPSVEIYPNPAENEVNVESNNLWATKSILTNMEGRTLIQWDFLPEKISLSSFEDGVYLLHIFDTKDNKITKKIIKASTR